MKHPKLEPLLSTEYSYPDSAVLPFTLILQYQFQQMRCFSGPLAVCIKQTVLACEMLRWGQNLETLPILSFSFYSTKFIPTELSSCSQQLSFSYHNMGATSIDRAEWNHHSLYH